MKLAASSICFFISEQESLQHWKNTGSRVLRGVVFSDIVGVSIIFQFLKSPMLNESPWILPTCDLSWQLHLLKHCWCEETWRSTASLCPKTFPINCLFLWVRPAWVCLHILAPGSLRGYPIFLIVQSLSHVQLFVTPWTVAHQAPLSMEFSRQEDLSGLPFPSPWLPHYLCPKRIDDLILLCHCKQNKDWK